MTNPADPKIIVALDFPSYDSAVLFSTMLDPKLCSLKVGKELFTAEGPKIVKELTRRGFDIFLDLKYHDIPNTVAKACEVAASLGVWMVNIHALGGRKMMEAAANMMAQVTNPPKLVAVTVLTSHDLDSLNEIGFRVDSVEQLVKHLALLAQSSGVEGVVCSAQETVLLRKTCGNDFSLVTPGIRLEGGKADDQVRIMTPEDAISAGSNYLVIGRPITGANDPQAALNEFSRRSLSASLFRGLASEGIELQRNYLTSS